MFFKTINIIKLNNLTKKKFSFIKFKKNELDFLKKLIKLNIIKYIFKYKNKHVLVLNFFKKNKIIFKLTNNYKKSNFKKVKLININKINKKNRFILLTTNKGLLDNYEAQKYKIGGLIILTIWN